MTTITIFLSLIASILGLSFLFLAVKRHRCNPNYNFLEIIPPLFNDNQIHSITMYYKVLHGLLRDNSYGLWKPVKQISLELVSDRAQGIRFIAVVPAEIVKAFQTITITHLPGAKIVATTDYLKHASGHVIVDSFHLKKKFIYPLSTETNLDLQDPFDYQSGAMTKLGKDEVVAMQFVLATAAPRIGKRNLSRLLRSYSALQKNGPVDFLTQSKYEHLAHKVQQPLFKVHVRTVVILRKGSEAKMRRHQINNTLASIEGGFEQGLVRRIIKWKAYRRYAERHLSSLANKPDIISREELSSLIHFPVRKFTRTENLAMSLSRTLPAPVSLKNVKKLDVILGVNRHNGTETLIGLTEPERDRHVYIIGGTGNGKTTMLLYALTQDIRAGKGLAVLDPHGDLAEELLKHIPEDRIRDVIYMNPNDLSYPVGVNLLELPEGLTGDDLLREKDLVTELTISVMRKIFSEDDTGGHRIEYVLRNTIQTALTLNNPTLFTIFDLLNNTNYRKKVVAGLNDKDLKNFWRNEFGKAGQFQKIKMTAGITAKIGRFLFSASAKRVLEQPKSTINFEEIMDSGKVLICNFSKGMIGEDTSTLFGTTILAKLQMASLRRARLSRIERRPFYLYVDEFQNFATMSFVQMLSEARKYKLFLTMAEQSTSQQQYQRLVEVILANVGTIVCFRSGSPADERLVLPLFRPFIEEGEIANLPTYNFYMRIAALQAQEPLSGVAKLVDKSGRDGIDERVKKNSRLLYAVKYTNQEVKWPTSQKKENEDRQTQTQMATNIVPDA